MRRLPVYFLIDVSESMVGEPIQQVEEGIATIIKDLRTDPYALETVYVSIIVFAGKAKKIAQLNELSMFYPPRLPIGGGTSLGSAIDFLIDELDTSLVRTSADTKGDWKPVIFLFTDGVPTDETARAIDRWNKTYRNRAFLVAISFGDNTDMRALGQLTDKVLQFKNTDPAAYKQFFKWVTASIRTTSIGVNENNSDEFQMAKTDENVLARIDLSKNPEAVAGKVDLQHAVFIAKCQLKKTPYLIKYSRTPGQTHQEGLDVATRLYRLQGAYPIDNQYFDLLDSTSGAFSVSTASLTGFPTCPCCGNQDGFSTCACGNILCTGREEVTTCPWCGTQAKFGYAQGHQNIARGRG